MSESLQDQLARLAKAGGLRTVPSSDSGSEPKHSATSSQPSKLRPNDTQYEDLTIKIEELRGENVRLSAALKAAESGQYAELILLKEELDRSRAHLEEIEQSNRSLIEDNAVLKRRIEALPDQAVIQRWRDSAMEANAIKRQANELMASLGKERRQLQEDRAVFEVELGRLSALDEQAKNILALKAEVETSEKELLERLQEAEKEEERLNAQRLHLESLSQEFNDIEARLGHLRGIERSLREVREEHTKTSRLYESAKTRVRNLTAERNEALQARDLAELNERKLSRELKQALSQMASIPDGEVIIRSFDTLQWMVSLFDDPDELVVPKRVLLLGDGPWPIDQFSSLLQELGFEVWQDGCDSEIEVVIVGRDNWSESVVDDQIEERDGETLRVYPQELFVLLLAMKADPFVHVDRESLLKFVDGHPVFDYLLNQEFPWPESSFEDGPPGTVGEGFDAEDASSPLYKMGYSVAQQAALSQSTRHELLEKTYAKDTLPWCISDEYMEDWGDANSRKRLRRIAWHLYLMTKRFKRHEEAVARWESDLSWLKRTHYKPAHRFRWPY